MSVTTEQEQVVTELRAADKLLLTTHENPDGDALGSLLGMHQILTQLGKDSLMFMSEDEFPLPWEYRQWTFERLAGTPPADVHDRTIVFLLLGLGAGAVYAGLGLGLVLVHRVSGVVHVAHGAVAAYTAYVGYFETDQPARTTIGVAALPLGAHVEIDAVLAVPDC